MRAPVLLVALVALVPAALAGEPTVEERVIRLKEERTVLQARADGEARLLLLAPLRSEGLLTDALAAYAPSDANRTIDELPAPRREAFAALGALNEALKETMARPTDGGRALAQQAGVRAAKVLDDLAATDDQPVILHFGPRVVAPREPNDLLVALPEAFVPSEGGTLQLRPVSQRTAPPAQPVQPRYAPDFVAAEGKEAPVEVEIVGLRLESEVTPTLALGSWRGAAAGSAGRLRFAVPRSAFESDVERSAFAIGFLSLRRAGRLVSFELPFFVLPDRPGSVALDQKVRWVAPETNALMSPEIVVRAPAGETRSLRRCFEPPAGWHFDKQHRRVVIVERLGWLDDISDATLNGGTVDFAPDEAPDQVCLVVSASPVTKGARTATIGRFEATLTREQAQEKAVQSGVRALDWNEPVRLALEPQAVERRLYLRLLGEIVRESADLPEGLPFLRIARDGDTLVLQADPTAQP